MIVRASKRVLRILLRDTRLDEQPKVIAHFLNCFLGVQRNEKPQASFTVSPLDVHGETPAWTELTPEALQEQLVAQVARRFRYTISAADIVALPKKQTLRQVCLKSGIQLQLREYDFVGSSDSSMANGHANANGHHGEDSAEDVAAGETKTQKKKRKAAAKQAVSTAASGSVNCTFSPVDILNVVPVVKDSVPRSTIPDEAIESGRACLQRGERDLGIELMIEGLGFSEQIYGTIHPEVSRAYAQYAQAIHHQVSLLSMEVQQQRAKAQAEGKEAEDIVLSPLVADNLTMANALRFQRQAVTIAERMIGIDAQETLHQWINLAVIERLNRDNEAALVCQKRVLELWDIIHGLEHPESVQSLLHVGSTLLNSSDPKQSLPIFQSAHELARKVFGAESIYTAQAAHAMGEALTLCGDLKGAVQYAKEANTVFEARLGKEDEQTKESEQFLSALAAAAVRQLKSEQGAQQRREAMQARIGSTSAARFRAGQQTSSRGTGPLGSANGSTAANVAGGSSGAAAASAAAASAEEAERLASMSVSEIVKYIQGESGGARSKSGASASSSKGPRGGKSRTRR